MSKMTQVEVEKGQVEKMLAGITPEETKRIEIEVNNIMRSGIPKAVNIGGKRVYISKKIIVKLRQKDREYNGSSIDNNDATSEGNEYKGGFLFLPFIFWAIGAAVTAATTVGTAAAAISSTVSNSRQAQRNLEQTKLAKIQAEIEQKKLTKMEQEENNTNNINNTSVTLNKDGGGLFLSPHQGRGLYDFFKTMGVNKSRIKHMKMGAEVVYSGDGLFLSPYKK
jgi:hypothetical protein